MQVQGAARRWGGISRRRFLAGAVTGATLLMVPREVLGSTGPASATPAASDQPPGGTSVAVVEPTPQIGSAVTASPEPFGAPVEPLVTSRPAYEVLTQDFSYRKQRGTVHRPDADAPHPVVYFLHGGFWEHGDRHQYDGQARAWAERGWVAVSLDYSLGVDYRTMLRDLWAGVGAIERQPWADPDRQIVSGDSAGGHLAALLAVRYPAHFRGQILWSPVISPGNAYADGRGTTGGVQHLRTASKLIAGRDFRGADPSRQVDADTPPLWIAASRDEFVPYDRQGHLLARALGRKRVSVHLEPGSEHGLHLMRGDMLRAARDWAAAQVQH